MLFFAEKPDIAFHKIVQYSLEIASENLKEEYLDDDDVMSNFYEQTSRVFNRKELLSQIKDILTAHTSNKLFRLTDYHFLILHDVIYTAVCLHNDFAQSGEALFSDLEIKHIDFGCIADIFFWDEDFLISSDIFDNLLPDAKSSLNFSEETFGVVHGLKPHPEEVKLKFDYIRG